MIKRLLLIIFCCIQTAVLAGYNDIYIANIEFDWINKNEVEKEAIVSEVHDIIFENPVEPQKNIKSMFSDKLKDKNRTDNYLAASAGLKEYKGNYISAFYFWKMKSIYMYALQDKKDVSKSFYYDALGNLKYVDFIEGEFPDYPYTAIQYKVTGQPVSAIYYLSKDCQYLFSPEGEFKGVWYKHNLYNMRNKIVLKRTTY